MTTQRGEDPAAGVPGDETWFTHPVPRTPPDDALQSDGVLAPRGSTRAERRRAREAAEAAGRPFTDAFVESPSGTWMRADFDPAPTGAHAAPDRPGDPRSAPVNGAHAGPGPAAGDRSVNGVEARFGPADAADRDRSVNGAGAGFGPAGGDLGDRPVNGAHAGDPGPGRGSGDDRDAMDGDGGWAAATRAGGRRHPAAGRREAGAQAGRVADDDVPGAGFDPGNTGTWRVRDVVPGADGGRRTTTILRYLLGLLAIDHVRALTRWAFVLPFVGLLLLLVHPRWIGLAVVVLGVLLIVGRIVAVRTIVRRTLPRRYRPVEDDLRAAVEAGKANLRGELRRVGMPSSALALPRSVVRLGSSDSRSSARSQLRDIEIDRVLPRAQLDRALRVLDGAPTPR